MYGIFGTSLTAMAMLSLAGIVLSIDALLDQLQIMQEE